jgi:hypothetical protein
MAAEAAISDGMELNQVYWPLEGRCERLLEIKEVRKAAGHLGLEFHQHIDITALGVEVAAEHRSEYFEFAHAMKAAQSADFFQVVVDQRGHGPTPDFTQQYLTRAPDKISEVASQVH